MGRKKKKGGKGSPDGGFPRRPETGLLGAIPTATLDLHGVKAAAAERKVTSFVTTQARIAPGRVLHLVTGSGLGSPGGPVLRGLVGELLDGPLAPFVADHRLDLHRGGWLVRLR